MRFQLVTAIRMTFVLLVITCAVYPGMVWGIGQLAFRRQANGSLIERDGRVIGSELIGQNFSSDGFFHPRPSAAGSEGYDASSSGGTNLGPTSKKLRDAIQSAVSSYRETRVAGGIPADAVTSSASGLDPHISPENAMAQAARVARANRLALTGVEAMVRARTEGRFIGVFGEPRVNVLLLNLDILAARHNPHS